MKRISPGPKCLLLFFGLVIAPLVAAGQTAGGKINIVVLGSSTAAGTGPQTAGNAWVQRYRAYLQALDSAYAVINLARGGYTTYHIMPSGFRPPGGRPAPDPARNISAALALAPAALIINLPSNDVAYEYSVDEQLANYSVILAQAHARNVPVWITTAQPRRLTQSGRAMLQALRDSTFGRFGERALDFWSGFADSSGAIDPRYDSGDGIHLNDAAHELLFERVVAARVPAFAWRLNNRSTTEAGLRAQHIRVLDDFESLQGWRVIESEGVRLDTARVAGRSGRAIRLDFNFAGGAGYCGIQKRMPITLPENYQFSFYLKADAPPNNLEFKLLDGSGENVWWMIRRGFAFPKTWSRITVRKRQISFAWGPATDRRLTASDKIEFIISASSGGKGSVYLDDFTFTELPAATPVLPEPVAFASSNAGADRPIAAMLDHDPATAWRSAPAPRSQSVLLDLQQNHEYGGLVIDWDAADYAETYEVLVSADGRQWQPVYEVSRGKGGRAYISLKDTESRFLLLQMHKSSQGRGYAIRDLRIEPIGFSETPAAFFAAVARDQPAGYFPKYLQNRQSYWTVVGAAGDSREALINEEGMVEIDKGGFSIMPFVYWGNRLWSWDGVRTSQSLEAGSLPIPSVNWRHQDFELEVKAFAHGAPDSSALYLIYRLKNTSDRPAAGHFYLTLRPFQVNPPWQFLGAPGGPARIESIHRQGNRIIINDDKAIIPLPPPDGFGALTFDEGDITAEIARDALPNRTEIHDHFGYASAALRYAFELAPGQEQRVVLAVPFHQNERDFPELTNTLVQKRLRDEIRFWQHKLNAVEFRLPASAAKIVNTLRSNLAYILINRDGPGIQPGSRSYERSWIRDGALTSAALLRFGIDEEVKEFLDWYAGFQYPTGKVPCAVDGRGADPVPENDSNGEFLYALLQYYLFTGDLSFLNHKWGHVQKAVAYLDTLVSRRTTEKYKNGPDSLRALYGLLPESISHEGYSAKPMHSYWDDFFALKGYKDAAVMAGLLHRTAEAAAFSTSRDTFQRHLYRSLDLAIAYKKINYIPGAAELGDFDATSTAIAVYPGNELENLPQPYLKNTFDRYYDEFTQRLNPDSDWQKYTPYEVRVISAFIYMGAIERAHKLLEFFLTQQRPAGWNHWAEVVWRDPQAPEFIGDMPHTWVGSDFINAVRAMFIYEKESDQSLVVGAGLYQDWLDSPTGIEVRRLPTYYGRLSYTIRRRAGGYRMRLWGNLRMPEGKIRIKNFRMTRPSHVSINGKATPTGDDGGITVAALPATIDIQWQEF